MKKEMTDCQDIIIKHRSMFALVYPQFFFSSHELMNSCAATSQAVDAITRLTEIPVYRISAITDVSFFYIL